MIVHMIVHMIVLVDTSYVSTSRHWTAKQAHWVEKNTVVSVTREHPVTCMTPQTGLMSCLPG